MDTGTIAAIFITIFGCVFILAGVFLYSIWRRAQYSTATPVTPNTPDPIDAQKYRVRRGRMVPMSDKHSIISSRSGWTSLGRLSLVFAARDQSSFDAPRKHSLGVPRRHGRPHDLENQMGASHAPPQLRSPPPEYQFSQPRKSSLGNVSVLSAKWSPKWPKSSVCIDSVIDPSSSENSLRTKSSPSIHPLRQHKLPTSPLQASFQPPPPPPAVHYRDSFKADVAQVVRFIRPNFRGSQK